MLQIAICDDEQNSRDYVKQLIELTKNDWNISYEVSEFSNGKDLLDAETEWDLLFLDIALDETLSGMEAAKRIRNRASKQQPILIFVTGFKEYVFDAFDVDAFHYLLKPIDEEKFQAVFQKALQQLTEKKEHPVKTIHIQNGIRNKIITMDEIFYIESQNHKILLHTKDGIYDDYARIRDLEEQLQEQFFRIHKGYLVNLAYLEHYTKTEVVLTNGEVLPLSKYKYADFVKAYLRFME